MRRSAGILVDMTVEAPKFRKTLPGSPASDGRDQMIVRARRLGYSLQQIADMVGMSKPGVYYALKRIGAGRAGRF
jgi:hypothetical protein